MNSPYRQLASVYEVPGGHSRILAMEGLRGLAVVLVYLIHFSSLFSPCLTAGSSSRWVSAFLEQLGWTGVELFFLLSGYLIYGGLTARPVPYLAFQQRRLARIYPTFLVIFAVYLVLSVLVPSESKLPADASLAALYLLANAALLPGVFPIKPMITVAWSLSYEMFFYLALPIVVRLAALRTRSRGTRALCLVFGLLFCFVIAVFSRVEYIRFSLFLVGALLYEMLQSPQFVRTLNRSGEWLALATLLAGLTLVSLLAVKREWFAFLPANRTYYLFYCTAILSVAFGGLTVFAFGFPGFIQRACSWTPLRWLGNMSYSYYLIHGLTLKALSVVLFRFFPPSGHSPILYWVLFVLAFLATLVSSTALFVIVEKPLSLRPRQPAKSRPQRQLNELSGSPSVRAAVPSGEPARPFVGPRLS